MSRLEAAGATPANQGRCALKDKRICGTPGSIGTHAAKPQEAPAGKPDACFRTYSPLDETPRLGPERHDEADGQAGPLRRSVR
jgi:hypothetical protein